MAASTMLSATGGILDEKAGSKNGKSARKRPAQPPIKCPECDSLKTWKDGFRYTNLGSIQRYICRNCGYRFSDPNFQHAFNGSGMFQHVQNVLTKKLKRHADIPNPRQVCAALTRGTKNLTEVETRQEKAQREGTKQTADVKGKIFEFAWWLKKNGKSESTIRIRSIMLRILVQQGANLTDPESIKEVIALRQCSGNTKRIMVESYKSFAEFNEIKWKPPHYKGKAKIPFIPLEREIDDLIACCSKKTAALLQLLKETGARLGEALQLKWTELDTERRIVRIEPEKGSNPRALKISEKLLAMLNNLSKDNVEIFGGRKKQPNFQESLYRFRRKAAGKLQNPRILQIHFHTLRHWKGTMEYHKTKDPWHVKKVLGHKSLRSTELYINIDQAMFEEESDEFHVKVAEKPDEIKALLEIGFEYVCEKEGAMFFKKRK